MKATTLAILACPGCHQDFISQNLQSTGDTIVYGTLICPACSITVPICSGFALFIYTMPYTGKLSLSDLQRLEAKWFGTPERYQQFIKEKQQRPVFDVYAATQTFSEATRSLFPLSEVLQESLHPGDYILDTWCRTGWSGEMLAGLFPEQHLIALWEGNHDCLGLAGFRHWLNQAKRAKNLDILFLSLEKPLPFKSKVFKFTHAFDTLHRYSPMPLINELLRTTQSVIAFSHVHLSNSQPNPYFEREGPHYHGKEYQTYFKNRLKQTDLTMWVLSEKALFKPSENFVLQDDADTGHYNGFILLADQKWQGKALQKRVTDTLYPDSRIFVNPLLHVDLNQQCVSIAPLALAGKAPHYLSRHPLYAQVLQNIEYLCLSTLQCQILYFAQRLMSVAEIAEHLHVDWTALIPDLQLLRDQEVVQIYRVSFAMQQLQYFYTTQQVVEAYAVQHFATLWASLSSTYPNEQAVLINVEDDSHFYLSDIQTIVAACSHFFLALGLKPGDHLVIYAHHHVEYLCSVWAAWLCGIIVIPIDASLPSHTVVQLVQQVQTTLILTDESCFATLAELNILYYLFDSHDASCCERSFAKQLQNYLGLAMPAYPALSADNIAAILFTSGSTGSPKGVTLSHGAFYRSSKTLGQCYAWCPGDRYLILGGMHTMSGLRNPAFAALYSGVTLLVPPLAKTWHPRALWELCAIQKISILMTVPALLKQMASECHALLPLPQLKQILCTGAPLASALQKTLMQRIQTPIYNYYGLTETCGICIVCNADYNEPDSIGKPQGVIAQIVDANACILKPGQVGELRIFGEQLMQGYFKQPELTAQRIQHGWLYTGDLAYYNSTGGIVLLGRSDEQKKDQRGEIFYLSVIERLLESHPAVQEASIVDLAGANFDYQLAAFIIPRKQSADFANALPEFMQQFMARDKAPQHYVIVAEFPRGSNGKVLKNVLIEDYLQYATPVA